MSGIDKDVASGVLNTIGIGTAREDTSKDEYDGNILDDILNTLQNVMDIVIKTSDIVLPLGFSFSLPLISSTLVMEKEYRLRALMVMMGLDMRWYWLCEWLCIWLCS